MANNKKSNSAALNAIMREQYPFLNKNDFTPKELNLMKKYGDEYLRYKKQVERMENIGRATGTALATGSVWSDIRHIDDSDDTNKRQAISDAAYLVGAALPTLTKNISAAKMSSNYPNAQIIDSLIRTAWERKYRDYYPKSQAEMERLVRGDKPYLVNLSPSESDRANRMVENAKHNIHVNRRDALAGTLVGGALGASVLIPAIAKRLHANKTTKILAPIGAALLGAGVGRLIASKQHKTPGASDLTDLIFAKYREQQLKKEE